MKFFALMLCGLSLSASVYAADNEPISVSMVAVQASNEGRSVKYFGEGLQKVRSAIGGLDYDTFSKLTSIDTTIPLNEETKFRINEHYSLYLTPMSIDGQGRIRMRARLTITSRDKDKTVNALDTVLTMAPGKHLNLGGLRLDNGELVVVLTAREN
ncbi:MAG: hypothetical protein COA73_03015 [Candidatus Hydrogenedentota bacterium]|nr:MAG: hypothetical protein COA73_03015 [Candidatus Hydrogenedentota bacterium]